MWGLIIWASMKLFWTIYLLQQFSIPEIDLPFWKKYIPRLMPLLLLALIGKGSEYLNNLMVSILFEEEKAFAIYRYGAREFPISVLLVSALSTSLLPLLSENLHSGLEAIRDATRKLSHFLFPASILTLLLSPVIFPIVFSQDFRDSARIFNIFGLLLGSRILMPQVVLMAHQRNMFLTYAAIVEMAILTSLSYILGGRFGMEGVAAAMVISFMIERIILICYCWHNLGVRPDSYIHWPTWVVYNGLLYLFFGISYLLY
jgi:O-antigen/teichoic acid export membrane protein